MLNLHDESRGEVRAAALLGIILQLGVIVYGGCATYYPILVFAEEGPDPVASYAFPCMATGTVSLVIGLLLCGHVVESSTHEKTCKTEDGYEARHIWLQRKATVGDQAFGSFAIFSKNPRDTMATSRRSSNYEPTVLDKVILAVPNILLMIMKKKCGEQPYEKRKKRGDDHSALLASKSTIGTIFSLVGFIVQFVGLRGVHWSNSLFQLGAVLIMTLARIYVRREHARPPESRPLPAGFELDWFAMMLAKKDSTPWLGETMAFESAEGLKDDTIRDEVPSSNSCWSVAAGENPQYEKLDEKRDDDHSSPAHQAMTIRKQLSEMSGWHSMVHTEAGVLKRAIELVMDSLFSHHPRRALVWKLDTRYNDSKPQFVDFQVNQVNGAWTADVQELEAALSLWLYSVDEQRRKDTRRDNDTGYDDFQQRTKVHGLDAEVDEWFSRDDPFSSINLRLLGKNTRELRRDLQWWMPRNMGNCMRVWQDDMEGSGGEEAQSLTMHRARVVGYGLDLSEARRHGTSPSEIRVTRSEQTYFRFEAADSNADASALLATSSSCSLKMLYAQELFSAFMWAVAKTMPAAIGGTSDLQVSDASDGSLRESFTLSNKRLAVLANDIKNTGLANLEGVFTLIIPPLSGEQKLPAVHSIIEFARQEAKMHEQRGDLIEAGDVYVWLFRAMRTFPKDSEVAVKATAVLVEHLKSVDKEFDHWERCIGLHDSRGFKNLQKHKFKIENELEASEHCMALLELYHYRWDTVASRTQGPRHSKPSSPGKEGERIVDNPSEEQQQTKPELPETYGYTKMHAAARHPSRDINIWEDTGMVNSPDIFGRTSVHYAAATKHSGITRNLAILKAHVDVADLGGRTPLHYACDQNGNATWNVRHHLKAGADVNAQARDGTRPIHCAAERGDESTLRILAEAGATIDALDSTGKSPLMRAALGDHKGAAEYLSPISNRNLRDAHGRNALHMAALSGDLHVVEMFAEEKYYSQDRNGHTPLDLAALVGHVDMVRFLMGRFETRDEFANPKGPLTPLHSAISAGHGDIARLLIQEFKVGKETPDGAGWTPLQCAAWAGQENMVRLLIEEFGADREARGTIGWTPLFAAVEMNQGLALARTMIEKFKCDVHARTDRQRTLLHAAANTGDLALVRYLIGEQALDVNARDHKQQTPLFFTGFTMREEIMRMLVLEFSADVNARDESQKTPLHVAAMLGFSTLVELLIRELGADMEARDHEQQTPLHMAARHRRLAVMQLLIREFGADIEALDTQQQTPLQVAAANGMQSLI